MSYLLLKILHFEDTISDAELIKIELERSFSEFIIHQCSTKKEFIELLALNEYNLVISDYSIPMIFEMEAFDIARQFNPSIPFIYVSGEIGEEKAVELLKCGVTDYVNKSNLIRLPLIIKRALRDVKENKNRELAEIKIRESEARYRGLFEKMNEGLVFSTPKGIFKMANPYFCKLVEYSEEELIGKFGYEFLTETKFREEIKKKIETHKTAIKEAKSEKFEVVLISKSGVKLWTQISISPQYNIKGDLQGVMALVTNITEQKKAEEEAMKMKTAFLRKLEIEVSDRTKELSIAKMDLATSLKREKELGELKSRFVSTASHQFRTPLTVILSSIGVLSLHEKNMSDEFKLIFEKTHVRIKEQVERMTGVMNDVLILGKINAGNDKPKFTDVDLKVLCEEIAKGYNEIQKDGRTLSLRTEGEPYTISLDSSLIEHSISNFVSNAFKYSVGKPSPQLFIYFEEESVRISIKDYGVGIPEKDLVHIFDPFFRASNVMGFSGTGLGTAIAKEYVELNNGKIEVKSQIEKGSEFILTFGAKSI